MTYISKLRLPDLNEDLILKDENAYVKPGTGIPKEDLKSDVQASLEKADTALQSHQDLTPITEVIPNAATSTNQLADKAFVNSSIATSTATFRGTSATGLTEQQFLT